MKDAIKYGLLAVGGWIAWGWLQDQQQAEPAPATNGGVTPGQGPGQTPAATTPAASTPPTQAPATNPQMIYGVSVAELAAKLGGAGNFWQWNWAMQQIKPDWPMPAAQPFFVGSTDAEIGSFMMTAQQYFNKLAAGGW